ncbi:MAG: FtsX-like permease family protein [Candidatus Moraniibacteriota bacterium]
MKDFKTAVFIAYKSIRKGNQSMMLLIICILALSFLNMSFISGVLSGVSQSEVQVLKGYISSDVLISPQEQPRLKQYIPEVEDLRNQVSTIPGVIATARHYVTNGLLSFDKDKSGQVKTLSGSIIGIEPTEEHRVMDYKKLLFAGQFLSDDDTDQVVLSSALAGGFDALAPSDLGGVKVGDKVQITYANGILRTYTVKGIYDDTVGIFQTFVTVKEVESVLGVADSASHILIKTDLQSRSIEEYQSRIQALVPKLKVQDYYTIIASFIAFLKALDLISLTVSVISVLVAAITTFVLIYINALSKMRQIGILKAIGIKQEIIICSYIFQSLFYTLFGVMIGSGVIFGIVQPLLQMYPIPLIERLMDIVLVYTPEGIFISIAVFFVAGFLAGLIPSFLVAKKDILDTIWG